MPNLGSLGRASLMQSQNVSCSADVTSLCAPYFLRGFPTRGTFAGPMSAGYAFVFDLVGLLASKAIARPLGRAPPKIVVPYAVAAAPAAAYCLNRFGSFAAADQSVETTRNAIVALLAGALVFFCGASTACDTAWVRTSGPRALLLVGWLLVGGLLLGLTRAGVACIAGHLVRSCQLERRIGLVPQDDTVLIGRVAAMLCPLAMEV